MADNHPYIFI